MQDRTIVDYRGDTWGDETPDPVPCAVGGHLHHDQTGRLCSRHLAETGALILDVARQTRKLGQHLIPDSAPAIDGVKVTTSRVGSPTPARLDVLSLIGPGGREIRRDARNLAPVVRRWSTLQTYRLPSPGGKPVTLQVRVWHAEVVTAGPAGQRLCRCGVDHNTGRARPLTYAGDDQVGAIPPAEWMDEQVRGWRLALQHAARTMPPGRWVDYRPPPVDADQDKRLTRAALGEWVRMTAGRPHMLRAVAAFLALRVTYAQARAQVGPALLGLRTDGRGQAVRAEDALAGARPPDVAPDPAAAEWIVRYGAARAAAAVEVDAHYLRDQLAAIADLDDTPDSPDLAQFCRELRALHRELQHVLGETGDEQWLGRCPVLLLDAEGQPTDRRCGAGLWHDPHLVGWRIECPRCTTTWPETEWLSLAVRIRAAWPIDTRRRYTAGDRRAAELTAAMPRCSGCDRVMAVDWRPSPARGDREPWWRPTRLYCPAGCLAGGTAAAA